MTQHEDRTASTFVDPARTALATMFEATHGLVNGHVSTS